MESGILADPGPCSVYIVNETLLEEGDICRNKRLARTLRTIADHGPQVLYNGYIGLNLVQDIQRAGGIITMKDVQEYRVKEREPVSAYIMGLKIFSMPPPSSSGVGMIHVSTTFSLIPSIFRPILHKSYADTC